MGKVERVSPRLPRLEVRGRGQKVLRQIRNGVGVLKEGELLDEMGKSRKTPMRSVSVVSFEVRGS